MNRMRLISLCLIILFFGSSIYAQNKNKHSVFCLATGISLPTSDFANTKFDYDAGFASTGVNFQLDYYRYTGKYFALNTNIGYSNFTFNNNEYRNEYQRLLNKSNGIKITTGHYQILKGSLGLVFKTPKIHSFEFLIIPQIGYSLCYHPNIEVIDDIIGELNSIKKNNDSALFFSFEAKGNFYISDKYGLFFSYGRSYVNPSFKDITSYEQHFYLPIKYQNFNFGLTISI